MGKENFIWIFIALVLVVAIFNFGMNYGKGKSSITGNIIYDNYDNVSQEKLNLLENELNNLSKELKILKEAEETTEIKEIIIGGGYEVSKYNTYEVCKSWGDVICINNELICPEGYDKTLTGWEKPTTGQTVYSEERGLHEKESPYVKEWSLCVAGSTLNVTGKIDSNLFYSP